MCNAHIVGAIKTNQWQTGNIEISCLPTDTKTATRCIQPNCIFLKQKKMYFFIAISWNVAVFVHALFVFFFFLHIVLWQFISTLLLCYCQRIDFSPLFAFHRRYSIHSICQCYLLWIQCATNHCSRWSSNLLLWLPCKLVLWLWLYKSQVDEYKIPSFLPFYPLPTHLLFALIRFCCCN